MNETAQDRANQCNDILKFIRKHGSINPMQALNKFGCMRLAARICDLRKQGFPIEGNMVITKNRYGKTVRYQEYRLVS